IEIANESIGSFGDRFQRHWLAGMRSKLGLLTEESDDTNLIEALLEWMRKTEADFTNTFRSLSNGGPAALSMDPVYVEWHQRWQARLSRQPQSEAEVQETMHRHNPVVIPRNHKVEEALDAAVRVNDLGVMERLLVALANPYDYAQDPPVEFSEPSTSELYQTFCGT
ncbi:MAG: protein adenylyltransferase SelO family protein, partial [Verrucomicrobium sp.]